jgi:6-phosphogluconolactonase
MARGNLSVAKTPVPTEHRFDSAQALAQALAQSVAAELRAALQARGSASLIASGGRTPAQFLTLMSQQELDWTKVWVSLADERWVDEDHPDSNAALVRKHLLQNYAVGANFVPLKNAAATTAQGESACTKALEAMLRPFDMVLLGMGDDDHTASLFPQAPHLAQALAMDSGQPCLGVDPVTAPHPRLTLTLAALLASRRIAVLFTAAGKWALYPQALQPGPVEALPVRAVLHQDRVPLEVYWTT